jgi:hypothetical protein
MSVSIERRSFYSQILKYVRSDRLTNECKNIDEITENKR